MLSTRLIIGAAACEGHTFLFHPDRHIFIFPLPALTVCFVSRAKSCNNSPDVTHMHMKYRYRWVTARLHLNGDVRATEVKRKDGCLFIIAENMDFNLNFTDQTIETNVINPLSLITCDLPFTKEIPSNHRNTDIKKKKIDFNHSLIAFFY